MAATLQDYADQAELAYRGLEIGAQKILTKGSTEYKLTFEQMQKVKDKWQTFASKEEIDEKELLSLRREVKKAKGMAEHYVEYKTDKGVKGKNAQYRMNSMKDTLSDLEAQMDVLDQLVEESQSKEAPNLDSLSRDFTLVSADISDANDVFRGSDQYKKAKASYDRSSDVLKKLEEKGQENITLADLEEAREELRSANNAIDSYLATKNGKVIDSTTQKRVDAMERGKDMISIAIRKFDQMEKALEVKPAKEPEAMADELTLANNEITASKEGVHLGSKEFEKAEKDFKRVCDKMNSLQEKMANGQLSSREISELERSMDAAEKSINEYLVTKRGKELDPKTQRRVNAMVKSKNAILESKRTLSDAQKKISYPKEEYNSQLMINDDKRVSLDLASAKAFNGSPEFDKAVEKYDEVTKKAYNNYRNKKYNPSQSDKERELKNLYEAREAIDKYLDKKDLEREEKKDKRLNTNGEKRVDAMKKAHNQLSRRIRALEASMDKKPEKDKENTKKEDKEKERKQIKQGIKDAKEKSKNLTGIKRTSQNATVAAMEQLDNFSRQKQLSKMDKEGMRRCIAAMIINNRLNGPNGKAYADKYPKNSKGLAKAITQLANSKEFKAVFPDKALTPSYAAKLATDPKALTRCEAKLKDTIKDSAQKDKIKQQNAEKVKKQELKKETPTIKNPQFIK